MKNNILVILDSHIGEVYQLSSILHYWSKVGDINCKTELIINVVRKNLTNDLILSELSWFSGLIKINNFEFTGESKFKKIKNFIKFIINIIFLKKIRICIVPYDQKKIFYMMVCWIFKKKIIAIPHTTGPEIYSDNIVEKMKQKPDKSVPILAKSKYSSFYYKKLGYKDVIIGGDYFDDYSYSQYLLSKLKCLPKKESIEIVVFSLGYIEDMFTYDSWFETHLNIFESLNKFKNIKVFFKLHPSQSKTQFLNVFSSYLKFIEIVDIHPEPITTRCDVFISILTSAGHHAINKGKDHCCFATNEMREGVKKFGNPPYPYDGFKSMELSSGTDLTTWIKNSIENKNFEISSSKNNDFTLMSLKCLEDIINEQH